MCDKSRNTWLCVHWQWNTLEWCQLNALQASPVVHLVTPLSCVSLSMNTQPSVPTIRMEIPVSGNTFPSKIAPRIQSSNFMEPTNVGSLWLENDLHENELEFESYMGRSKKNVRVTSDGIHAEIHEIWTCVAPAAPPLFHAAVNPCLQGESPWNWSCNSVNLRKGTVTWMRRHYVFTVISRWSTFSSTVNVCSINCVIFSDTHCSFGPPILWHSPFHAGVSVY